MKDQTRRGFMATAAIAGAGAAAAGVAGAASAGAAPPPASKPVAGASGALVAYVTDVQSAAVTVMVEDREVVIHDREIVNRLTRAIF